jgi:hypothetical protein
MEFDLFEPSLLRENKLPLAALRKKKAASLRGLVVDNVCSQRLLKMAVALGRRGPAHGESRKGPSLRER